MTSQRITIIKKKNYYFEDIRYQESIIIMPSKYKKLIKKCRKFPSKQIPLQIIRKIST